MIETTPQYLNRLNMNNLSRRLKASTDDVERATLSTLLAEEKAKARAAGWPPLIG